VTPTPSSSSSGGTVGTQDLHTTTAAVPESLLKPSVPDVASTNATSSSSSSTEQHLQGGSSSTTTTTNASDPVVASGSWQSFVDDISPTTVIVLFVMLGVVLMTVAGVVGWSVRQRQIKAAGFSQLSAADIDCELAGISRAPDFPKHGQSPAVTAGLMGNYSSSSSRGSNGSSHTAAGRPPMSSGGRSNNSRGSSSGTASGGSSSRLSRGRHAGEAAAEPAAAAAAADDALPHPGRDQQLFPGPGAAANGRFPRLSAPPQKRQQQQQQQQQIDNGGSSHIPTAVFSLDDQEDLPHTVAGQGARVAGGAGGAAAAAAAASGSSVPDPRTVNSNVTNSLQRQLSSHDSMELISLH
jgi:hypothetical protein